MSSRLAAAGGPLPAALSDLVLEAADDLFLLVRSMVDHAGAGPNFGIGSSREQAAGALVQLGVKAVIAPSFSGLFFRNAFNLGLLLLTCPQAPQLREAESITLDLQALTVTRADGQVLACEPIPAFLLDMVEAGGLLNQLRRRLGKPLHAVTT
jgi:3-isopropylmalate/(R)-2-methylmalate dehydratase small subunit